MHLYYIILIICLLYDNNNTIYQFRREHSYVVFRILIRMSSKNSEYYVKSIQIDILKSYLTFRKLINVSKK